MEKPQSISPQTSAVSRNHNIPKGNSKSLTNGKLVAGPEAPQSENVNFYDKAKSRKASQVNQEVDDRPTAQKELANLNQDLNSFRSQENNSAI